MISRRTLLQSGAAGVGARALGGLGLGAAGLGAALAPRSARAASVSSADLKFLFVFAPGGWDPTRVFADEFANAAVDMEALAERGTVGGIDFVDHPDRPSVRTFLEAWHARTVVLNGLLVRSIAHEICTMIALTGSTSGLGADWPALLADDQRDRYTLPHLVLGGPSFPGDLGVVVSRTGVAGQLENLLSGRAADVVDVRSGAPNAPAESLLDRYLARRAASRAAGARSALERSLTDAYAASTDRAALLKELQWSMDFTGGSALADQASVAVDALANGVSRCVTLASAGAVLGWDTHADNDDQQSPLWETLFSGLGQLLQALANTPGAVGASLADETVVVVLSEMGRSPQLNAYNGKDHWPYTSAMIVGPNLVGDRVLGGFDGDFYGKTVDPASGELDADGAVLSSESLGATLLAMADIDPTAHVDGVEPLLGILA